MTLYNDHVNILECPSVPAPHNVRLVIRGVFVCVSVSQCGCQDMAGQEA